MLTASESIPIDFYIYITSTGRLTQQLSTGTVNYEKAVDFIKTHLEIIKLPIWVIGIDIAEEKDSYPSPMVLELKKLINNNLEAATKGLK